MLTCLAIYRYMHIIRAIANAFNIINPKKYIDNSLKSFYNSNKSDEKDVIRRLNQRELMVGVN